MSDEIDRASKEEEMIIQNAIRGRVIHPTLVANGCCHYCEEKIEDGLIFCDTDCATDYEWLNKKR